jgi:predicted ester cyclase
MNQPIGPTSTPSEHDDRTVQRLDEPRTPREVGTALVRRLVDEVMTAGRLDVLDELATPTMARAARSWITPFRASFPDMEMETVQLVVEGDTVVGRFRCSGTHLGPWRGHEPTGRRFERVDEVYFFTVRAGRLAHAWGLEDTHDRLRQLGLTDVELAERHGGRSGERPPP